ANGDGPFTSCTTGGDGAATAPNEMDASLAALLATGTGAAKSPHSSSSTFEFCLGGATEAAGAPWSTPSVAFSELIASDPLLSLGVCFCVTNKPLAETWPQSTG